MANKTQVKLNPTSVIEARLGIQKYGPAHKFFTDTCYAHMDKYVPKRDNHLRTIVSFSIKGDSITYEQPYASYQYHGRRFDKHDKRKVRHYTTPGTGPYWDKRMWSAEKNEIIAQVQEFVDKGGK